jgi:hypothetical protein
MHYDCDFLDLNMLSAFESVEMRFIIKVNTNSSMGRYFKIDHLTIQISIEVLRREKYDFNSAYTPAVLHFERTAKRSFERLHSTFN